MAAPPPPPSPGAPPRARETEARCDARGRSSWVAVRLPGGGKARKARRKGSPRGKGGAGGAGAGPGGGAAGAFGLGLGLGLGLGSRRRARRLPQLFERASRRWWSPQFDSSNLEEACLERCFPQTRRRFRGGLAYLGLAGLLWGGRGAALALAAGGEGGRLPLPLPLPGLWAPALGLALALACLGGLAFSFSGAYARRPAAAALALTLLALALTLAPQLQALAGPPAPPPDPNGTAPWPCPRPARPGLPAPVGPFSLCASVLLLLYGVMALPLYLSLGLGLAYSLLFEGLGLGLGLGLGRGAAPWWELLGRALLHLCLHATGVHLFVMSQVRSRSTFLKVGQAIMHGKDLEVEKALKERMIHSVMPRVIADDLMRPGEEEGEAPASPKGRSGSGGGARKKPSLPKSPIVFRPFKMQQIEPVSILFADIVGFTKMSANKSAHALVGLLNDLFGRFDRLCEETKCEKISTLGDCYYCVAGCPEPRPDHAACCIAMGLGMIRAIEQFCQEKKETVNMRVGVHTGTVLCGILGMRRFKFDVWSNDVNLANLMEQLGVAGKVHVSEATARYLDDRYEMEDGRVVERVGPGVVADQLKGLRTYLISGLKAKEPHCSCSQALLPGLEAGDRGKMPGASSVENVGDSAKGFRLPEKSQTCPSCSIALTPPCAVSAEEGAVQNGGQDEQKHSTKGPGGCSPKSLNGLLSPPPEEKLSNSQTSLYEMLQEKGRWMGGSLDNSPLLPLRFKNIREKTDAHFVDVIKEDSLMKDYFFKPPINKLSLNFLDQDLEMTYRSSYQEEVMRNVPVKTFASATFSSLLDVSLSATVFLILSAACFLKHGLSGSPPPPAAVAVAVAALLLEVLSLIISIRMAFSLEDVMACTKRLMEAIASWLPRHCIGAVLISLPALAVFSHFTSEFETDIHSTTFMSSAILITIVQYCNFCQLSSWMRSSLATLVGGVLLVLLYVPLCPDSSWTVFNSTQDFGAVQGACNGSSGEGLLRRPADVIGQDVVLGLFLLLLLVWFLNREFEVSYRLHYHGDVEADLHRTKIQSMRDQADWLLRNIIPYHVAEQLKVSQSYSKNHDSGGVIFASIVNFGEFYEENYEGGKECYRVLNELIGDFDELLSREAFGSVEKIKTIGATYMAASGLNAAQGQDARGPQAHLQTLFEFTREMMRVVDDFNSNMLWFNFKLRVGFNHGPLTAGVIGTTKLLYDIWGDTVNIASRMDTTGVECRIQVSEESYRILHKMGYDFDYRGTVNVKGKGQMKTYLFPKCMDNGVVPHHQLSISPDIRVQVDGSIGRSPTDELSGLVPSVQSAAVAEGGGREGPPPGLRKDPPKEPAKPEGRPRLGHQEGDHDGGPGEEEANELTKLNSSRSV